MANEIEATFNPGVGSMNDTFVLTFSAPTGADRVTVTLTELDTWGSGPQHVQERQGQQAIIEIEGTIAGGRFTPSGDLPAPTDSSVPAFKIRFEGEADNVSHPIEIPAPARSNENGVFEIGLTVRATVNGQSHSFTSQQPVFLRNFRSGRPVIAFVTGSSGGYFRGANAFWATHADGKFGLTNAVDIREFLRTQAAPRGFGPWGEVNIVSHGNAVEWLIRLQRSDARTKHLRWWHLHDAMAANASLRTAIPDADAQTSIVIRGCAIGNDQDLLDKIRAFYGGSATVKAPKFLQFYHSGGSSSGPREGFFEFFFFYHLGTSSPSDNDAADRLLRENPGAGMSRDEWLSALRNRPSGGSVPTTPHRGVAHNGRDRVEHNDFTQAINIDGGSVAQRRATANAHDWMGDAEAGFDAEDVRKTMDTTFADWHWTMSPMSETTTGQRTRFERRFTATRVRIEVRRELRDASGNPVRPDLTNSDHFGSSP
jgi:hypothetical protein